MLPTLFLPSASRINTGFFWLCCLSSIKAKFEQCFEAILNIIVDAPLKVGQIFDIADVVLDNCAYCFRLPGGHLYDNFIGQQFSYKSVEH